MAKGVLNFTVEDFKDKTLVSIGDKYWLMEVTAADMLTQIIGVFSGNGDFGVQDVDRDAIEKFFGVQ